MTKPESYPFLRIAKQYGVDYGDVLTVADMWRHPADRDDRERAADKRLFLAMCAKPPVVIARLERELAFSNMVFADIQSGRIDWQTGAPRAEETFEFGYDPPYSPGPASPDATIYAGERLEDQKPVCKYCGQDHATTHCPSFPILYEGRFEVVIPREHAADGLPCWCGKVHPTDADIGIYD